MLLIYNETTIPWKIERVGTDSNVVKFSKHKDIFDKDRKKDGIRSQSISMLGYSSIIGMHENVETILSESISQTEVAEVFNHKSTIIFNKKAFRPFITDATEKTKDLLMVSINIKGQKLVALDNNETFFLEYFMFSGEFSFVASFNSPKAKLNITLLEESTRKVTTYSFFYEDPTAEELELKVSITSDEMLPKDQPIELAVLKRFRPSRPTYTVLVHPTDLSKLKETIDVSYHNIVVVSKENFAERVKEIKEANYRAVTLFVNHGFSQSKIVELSHKYFFNKKELPKQFNIVFVLHNDGRIYKLKY